MKGIRIYNNNIIYEAPFKKERKAFRFLDFFGILLTVISGVSVIFFFFYFLHDYLENDNKSTLAGPIAALLCAFFAFNVQLIFILSNSSKLKNEKREKTMKEYRSFFVEDENSTIPFYCALQNAWNKAGLVIHRFRENGFCRFYISSNSTGKINCSLDSFLEELNNQLNDEETDQSDEKHELEFTKSHLLILKQAKQIERLLALYYGGLIDQSFYDSLIKEFLDDICLKMLPILLKIREIDDYHYISYNLCMVEESVYGKTGKERSVSLFQIEK